MLNDQEMEQFKNLSNELIKFLNDKCHPHAMVIVTTSGSELLSMERNHSTEEFLRD